MQIIEIWRKDSSRSKNPKRHLPGRLIIATTICYSDDSTESNIGIQEQAQLDGKSDPMKLVQETEI